MVVRRRRRKTRRPYTKGNPVKSLMKIMNDHNFKQQLEVTADHLGMSKTRVLTEILGR